MPARATLLFLLLVGAPLLLLVWLSHMLVREQDQANHLAFQNLCSERLAAHRRLIEDELLRCADAFDSLLLDVQTDPVALRELPQRQPLIRHAFWLNPRHQLMFPLNQNLAPNSESAAFLRRTESVWASGIRPKFAQDIDSHAKMEISASDLSNAMVQQQSFTVRKQMIPISSSPKLSKDQATMSIQTSGWHLWFYGNGPQLLFWQQRANQEIIGIEIEMTALLSQVINRLSDNSLSSPAGLMRLLGADGHHVLHQWGNGEVHSVLPSIAEMRCTPPLQMWRLDYLPTAQEIPQTNTQPVYLGAGAAALAFLLVAWIFHRESTREMREARRRVSFVNQVSHELKTPLTNIRLYTELAQQQATSHEDANLQRQLHVVETETARLGRLIHNVLTFARQQRDQLTIHPKPTVLDDIIQRVIDHWRPVLMAHGFEIELQTQATTPVLVDPDAVEQILNNLISNVEKYASNGKFLAIRSRQDSHWVKLEVEDHGPGIPARQLETIFTPFTRLRNDLTEGVSGTGIGLSIARELARLHGGSLIAKNLNPGTSFTLKFPASDHAVLSDFSIKE